MHSTRENKQANSFANYCTETHFVLGIVFIQSNVSFCDCIVAIAMHVFVIVCCEIVWRDNLTHSPFQNEFKWWMQNGNVFILRFSEIQHLATRVTNRQQRHTHTHIRWLACISEIWDGDRSVKKATHLTWMHRTLVSFIKFTRNWILIATVDAWIFLSGRKFRKIVVSYPIASETVVSFSNQISMQIVFKTEFHARFLQSYGSTLSAE